jgi:hypothetical protein
MFACISKNICIWWYCAAGVLYCSSMWQCCSAVQQQPYATSGPVVTSGWRAGWLICEGGSRVGLLARSWRVHHWQPRLAGCGNRAVWSVWSWQAVLAGWAVRDTDCVCCLCIHWFPSCTRQAAAAFGILAIHAYWSQPVRGMVSCRGWVATAHQAHCPQWQIRAAQLGGDGGVAHPAVFARHPSTSPPVGPHMREHSHDVTRLGHPPLTAANCSRLC